MEVGNFVPDLIIYNLMVISNLAIFNHLTKVTIINSSAFSPSFILLKHGYALKKMVIQYSLTAYYFLTILKL